MNSGAHRRPSPQIGSPAIVWHRALWRPSTTDNTRWHHFIDRFLLNAYRNVESFLGRHGQKPICPNHDRLSDTVHLFRHKHHAGKFDVNDGVSTKHDSFSFRYKFDGATITLRSTLHNEFWDLTLILDLLEYPNGKPDKSHRIYKIWESISKIEVDIKDRYNKYPEISDEEFYRSSYSDVVIQTRQLFNDICGDAADINDRNISVNEAYGGTFADIVGVIFGFQPVSTDKIETLFRDRTKKPIEDLISPRRNYNDDQAMRLLNSAWPLVRHLNAGEDSRYLATEDAYGKPEYTATMFHGRRSLYISSLGRLIPEKRLYDRRNITDLIDPTVYTLINIHESRWQIGRLVERINDLEVLRIAALRDFSKIANANETIFGVQARLSSGHLESALELFNSIGQNIDGGLRYRVERSKYYINQFSFILSQMRLNRIEGFQQYDEFIKRRIFDKFSFIERVGRKHDDLLRDIRLRLDIDIKEKATKVSKTTNRLLRDAEIFIAIPATYYIGATLSHSIHFSKEYTPYLIGFLASAIIYIAVHLFRSKSEH